MISARSQCPAYGYSRVSFQGDRKYGHQVAIYLETGTWAGSEHVDHPDTCDKRCVNVAHLQVMTPSEHRAVTNARGENWPEGLDYKLGLTCRTGGCDKGVRVRGRELCSYHHARQIQPHHGKVG